MTDINKGQAKKYNKYRGKKTRTKPHGKYLEAETNFKGWCSDLEGNIFDLGPRAPDKFARKTKEL